MCIRDSNAGQQVERSIQVVLVKLSILFYGLKFVNTNIDGNSFNGFAPPGHLVKLLTFYFLSREHRRNLLNIASQCFEGLFDLFPTPATWFSLVLDGCTCSVAGISRISQANDRFIFFVSRRDKLSQSGCSAQEDHQDAGRERIKCARVTDST